MSLDPSGALLVEGNLSSAPPCTAPTCLAPDAGTWVRGYPSVVYGLDQCHARTSPPPAPALRLPLRVSAIPSDLIGRTSYSLDRTTITFDIAYDMWLSPSPTRTPCQGDGTVEVMVWTDADRRALLPADLKVSTLSMPYAVNGAVDAGTDAWSVYASDIGTGGWTAPWGGTVWLVLNPAVGIRRGDVAVDLSTALSQVAALLQDRYGWTRFRRSYWLDTVPFGLEYGPPSGTATDGGRSYFSFELSSYCLAAGTTLARTAC